MVGIDSPSHIFRLIDFLFADAFSQLTIQLFVIYDWTGVSTMNLSYFIRRESVFDLCYTKHLEKNFVNSHLARETSSTGLLQAKDGTFGRPRYR